LFKKADGETGREDRLSVEFFIDIGHDAQERALPGAVETDHADLGAVKIREGDVLQNRPFFVMLAHADHGVNDFL